MVITENKLNKIIEKVIKRNALGITLSEAIHPTDIGKNGPLSSDMLIDPKDLFREEYEVIDSMPNKPSAGVPKALISSKAVSVWKKYVINMLGETQVSLDKLGIPRVLKGTKEKDGVVYPKQARSFMAFMNSIRNGKFSDWSNPDGKSKFPIKAFGNGEDYLFGHYIAGTFVACYISCSGRGLLKLISELMKYDNVVFMVTLDMAPTFERAHFITDGKIHQEPYRGKMVEKKIFATSIDALHKGVGIGQMGTIDGKEMQDFRSKMKKGNLGLSDMARGMQLLNLMKQIGMDVSKINAAVLGSSSNFDQMSFLATSIAGKTRGRRR